MKKKKKNLLSTIDVVYICAMLCVLVLLIIPANRQSGGTVDSNAGDIKESLTYYLHGESANEVPSWIIIIPDNIWVNSNGDCGSYSYGNGIYTFFLNKEKLYTAQISDDSLVVKSKDNSLIYYPKVSEDADPTRNRG